MRYANNSNYKNDTMIRKEVQVSKTVLVELRRILEDSEVSLQHASPSPAVMPWLKSEADDILQITKENDNEWPAPDRVGRQELEVVLGNEHISFCTTKLGSLMQVQQSKDPDGLRVFYYLVQVCLSVSFFTILAWCSHAPANACTQCDCCCRT